MIKTQMLIGAALITGVAIGYFAKPDRAVEREPDDTAVLTALFSDRGEEASIAALRARVSELEGLLAVKGINGTEGDKSGEAESVPRADEGRRGPPSAAEIRERFARMEKEDPVRFSQMTNFFASMRRQRLERAQSKLDFLASVDTSRMNASAKSTHDELQELIASREELEDRMFNPDLSDDERRQLFEEMRETDMAIRELNGDERNNLIAQMLDGLGLEPEEAAEVGVTINSIIDATSGGREMRGGPPPGVGRPSSGPMDGPR